MAFKKGKDWKGNKFGRPRGASNRSSEMQKVNIQRMINEGLDYIKEDYHNIRKEDPAKAVTLLLKMMEYSIPKLKSVDISLDADIKTKIETITVNITDGITDKHNEDISQSS
jgi:uncharacterized surface anchored protein